MAAGARSTATGGLHSCRLPPEDGTWAGADGITWSQKLAAHEGILTGISGGSTFSVAMDVANKAKPGSKILCMLADTAERYLSSLLFENIEEEMSEEELEIFNSTN